MSKQNEPRFPDVTVRLSGEDGNAFGVLGKVQRELHRAGHGEHKAEYVAEATAGDYDHLLATTMRWVNVQ